MKLRVKMSIIFCIVFALLSSAAFFLHRYLGVSHHGIDSQSFAPVWIKKVHDEDDIMVHVHPIIGMEPHGYEPGEIPLNSIKKGWIIAQYKGYCRVLFKIDDEEYCYVQLVPRDRLMVTDFTARLGDEPTDPFAGGRKWELISDCSVISELRSYNYPRYCVAINAVFILLAVGINLIANAVEKRKQR